MSKAIYIVEYRKVSQGIGVLDRMFKQASLSLLYASPICIGKYLICVGGDVADVCEAKAAAEQDEDGPPLAGHLLLKAHADILDYFKGKLPKPVLKPDALGIFETRNAASGFISLDAALKRAQVDLAKLWLGQLLGGKFCYVLGGSTSDIESAMLAARAAVTENELAGSRIVASPDANTLARFYKGGGS